MNIKYCCKSCSKFIPYTKCEGTQCYTAYTTRKCSSNDKPECEENFSVEVSMKESHKKCYREKV